MKRAGNLIEKIADPENLRLAFWKARKGKEQKEEVKAFRKNLEGNLVILRQQILSGKVDVGNYHYFTIYDPKERVICAASFQERVLHHALMNICHQVFENFQIYDSYATRKNKGTYAALHRAETFQKKYAWFLKLDIRKYFDSINHTVLKDLLRRRFKDEKLLLIFDTIIDSYETKEGMGIPIGNLTSQYFANYYLAYADRYLKEDLKIPAFVRYMDDMVLWSNDKSVLLEARRLIANFLKIRLSLHLNRSNQGLSFIGYRIFDNYTKLNQRSKQRFKRKMSQYYTQLKTGMWSEEEYQRHIIPLIAFTQHASAYQLRELVIKNIGSATNVHHHLLKK
jgi:RNA-directed DNA polymerase